MVRFSQFALALVAFSLVSALAAASAFAGSQTVCSSLNPSLAGATVGTATFDSLVQESLNDGCVADVEDSSNPSKLYVEFIRGPLTGHAIAIGSTGARLLDIGLTPSGQLYGVDRTSWFYTVNQDTGAATAVGPVGYFVNGLVVSSTGIVYGSGNSQLLTINPATGAGTPIGTGIGFTSSGDLAFDANGNLYMSARDTQRTDSLVSIDPTTGVRADDLGQIGKPNVLGLGFSFGTLFGVDVQGDLLTINPATGAGTVIATGGPAEGGLATQMGFPAPFNTAPPQVGGPPRAGGILSCSPGSWSNNPSAYAYQWYRNGAPLAGFTTSTYTLGTLDEGTTLTCLVSASNAAGYALATSTVVKIPVPKVAHCPRATGRMTGTTLGQITLGMTRSRAEHLYRQDSDHALKYEDFFCLTPIGVRVGYASPPVLVTLSKRAQASLQGRVVWASTANPYYSLDGVRAGESITIVSRALGTERPFHIGLNYWYLARKATYTAVLKVRHGVVGELGIAASALTKTRKTQAILMHSFY
jgi:hypothetical protein